VIDESEFDHLWHAIGAQWPSHLGYVTSFLTIGGIWLIHHSVIRRIDQADGNVMRLNLLPITTTLAALRRYLATHRELLREDVSDEEVAAISHRTAPNGLFYALVVVALLLPQVAAAAGYLVIAVALLFRTRGDSAAPSRRRR
jgi:Endosomal/lysosomal potassium channel TMEM175